MSFTCDFGAFDEEMVGFLTGWNLSALDNYLWFYSSVTNLWYVYGERINLEILSCSSLSDLYGGQILFVDKDWQKAEKMASHHFWIWIRVSPSRVVNDICLVNCYASWTVYVHTLRKVVFSIEKKPMKYDLVITTI